MQHPYNFIPGQGLQEQLQSYQQIQQQNGDPSPLAISEYGFPIGNSTGDVDEETQAEYLTQTFQIARKIDLLYVMWFNYLDGDSLTYGVRKADYSWKLSALAYCNITGTPDCPVGSA